MTPKCGNWEKQRAGKALSLLRIPEAKSSAGSSSKSTEFSKERSSTPAWVGQQGDRRRFYITKSRRFWFWHTLMEKSHPPAWQFPVLVATVACCVWVPWESSNMPRKAWFPKVFHALGFTVSRDAASQKFEEIREGEFSLFFIILIFRLRTIPKSLWPLLPWAPMGHLSLRVLLPSVLSSSFLPRCHLHPREFLSHPNSCCSLAESKRILQHIISVLHC